MPFTVSRKKLSYIENLIMLSFTAVVFAGCAGNDIKTGKDQSAPANLSTEKTQTTADSQAYPVTPMEISSAETRAIDTQDSNTDSDDTSTSTKLALGNNPETPDNSTVFKLPDNSMLFYDTDKYKLVDDQRSQIQLLAEFLKTHADIKLSINGHADIRGTEKYNQSLSEKRAKTVFDLLVRLGVAPQQLIVHGYGELKPMHDKNNWDENRRVELTFSDKTTKLSSNR